MYKVLEMLPIKDKPTAGLFLGNHDAPKVPACRLAVAEMVACATCKVSKAEGERGTFLAPVARDPSPAPALVPQRLISANRDPAVSMGKMKVHLAACADDGSLSS